MLTSPQTNIKWTSTDQYRLFHTLHLILIMIVPNDCSSNSHFIYNTNTHHKIWPVSQRELCFCENVTHCSNDIYSLLGLLKHIRSTWVLVFTYTRKERKWKRNKNKITWNGKQKKSANEKCVSYVKLLKFSNTKNSISDYWFDFICI